MMPHGYYQESDEFLKKKEVFLKQEEEVRNGFNAKFWKTIFLQSTNNNDKTNAKRIEIDLTKKKIMKLMILTIIIKLIKIMSFTMMYFDGEIDLNEQIDEDDETSETENNMEMYELHMKKVYQEYEETEDGNYKKDQIKGHLQNEVAYLNGANVMGTKILNSTEKLLA